MTNQREVFSFMKRILASICALLCTPAALWAMGQAPQQAGGAPQGGTANSLMSFLPLVVIFVIFYFLLIRPQQKRAKEHKAMLETLKKGDKVMTSSGIFGLVEQVGARTITVKVAENVKIKFERSAIAAIRTDADED